MRRRRTRRRRRRREEGKEEGILVKGSSELHATLLCDELQCRSKGLAVMRKPDELDEESKQCTKTEGTLEYSETMQRRSQAN